MVFHDIFHQRPPKSRLNPGSLRPFSPEPPRNFPSSVASAILAAARAAVRGHRPPERGNPRAPAAPSGARVLVASRVWDLKRSEEMKERGATHTMILGHVWYRLMIEVIWRPSLIIWWRYTIHFPDVQLTGVLHPYFTSNPISKFGLLVT